MFFLVIFCLFFAKEVKVEANAFNPARPAFLAALLPGIKADNADVRYTYPGDRFPKTFAHVAIFHNIRYYKSHLELLGRKCHPTFFLLL